EDEVLCCYGRQTKLWAADPDGIHWELYVPGDQVGAEQQSSGRSRPIFRLPLATLRPREVIWTHQLLQPLPERIPFGDGAVDQVMLEGTLNLSLTKAHLDALLCEARRVLRGGGRIRVRGLVASAPMPVLAPSLPGPAERVERVPVEAEPMAALARAGF